MTVKMQIHVLRVYTNKKTQTNKNVVTKDKLEFQWLQLIYMHR